jgi:plasmid stability protein
MPTLNVPQDVYDRLEKMAAARRRSVEEAAVELLREALPAPEARAAPVPEFIEGMEVDLIVDVPLPASARPVPYISLPKPPPAGPIRGGGSHSMMYRVLPADESFARRHPR